MSKLRFACPLLLLALVYWAVFLSTSPTTYADTGVYAKAVVAYQDHGSSDSRNPFWEFGHLLWRPIAWTLWRAGQPLLEPRFSGNHSLEVYPPLIALNLVSGFLATLLVYGLARKLTARAWEAWAIALVFLCANPVLNYAHSGMSYVCGIVPQFAALYLLVGAAEGAPAGRGRVWGAGACMALSTLLWFPYVLAMPGILAAALFWKKDSPANWDEEARRRARFLFRAAVVTAVALVVAYASVALPNGFATPAKFLAWVTTAAHGHSQDRTLLRLGTALPRSLIDLGDDGLTLKRFLFHDPYAPVSAPGLLRLSLWKIGLVYLSLTALLFALWRTARRGALAALVIGAMPVLFFALVLFEPSSPERFMPAYPVLFPALAAAFAGFSWREWPKSVLALLFVSVVVVDLNTYALRTRQEAGSAVQRITALQDRLPPNSVVVLLSARDEIWRFYARSPFHPVNVRGALPLYDLIEAGTTRTAAWANEFSGRVFKAWDGGGEAWLSKRLFSSRPEPSWNWVEADDMRVAWANLPRFLRQLDTGGDVGGPDGFLRLERSDRNRRILLSALAAGAR